MTYQTLNIPNTSPKPARAEAMNVLQMLLPAFVLMASFAVLSLEFYFHDALNLSGAVQSVFFAGTGAVFLASFVFLLRSLNSYRTWIDSIHARHREQVDRLEREIRRKENEAVEFLESCVLLFEKSEIKKLSDKVMEVSERVLGADQGSVMLLDGRGKLKIVSSRGIGDDVASKVQLKLGERVAGLAALEKTEFLLNGTLDNYPLFKNLEGNPIIRSSMICPISHQDKVLGILNLSRTKREDAFTSQDLTRATLLAKQIGAALHYGQVCMMLRENAQQFKTMYRLYRQSREELSEIEKMSPVTVPFLKKPRLSA